MYTVSNAAQIPTQQLTPILSAKPGVNSITPDWLLSMPEPSWERPAIEWQDNSNILYSLPPITEKKDWEIEILNLSNHKKRILGEGSAPKPSPDAKWIAFTRGEGKEKQLWIMRKDGRDAKKLSNIKDGLGIYQFSYDYFWSPDSQKIALEHQPLIMPWEQKKRPESKITIINISTGESKVYKT